MKKRWARKNGKCIWCPSNKKNPNHFHDRDSHFI